MICKRKKLTLLLFKYTKHFIEPKYLKGSSKNKIVEEEKSEQDRMSVPHLKASIILASLCV